MPGKILRITDMCHLLHELVAQVRLVDACSRENNDDIMRVRMRMNVTMIQDTEDEDEDEDDGDHFADHFADPSDGEIGMMMLGRRGIQNDVLKTLESSQSENPSVYVGV